MTSARVDDVDLDDILELASGLSPEQIRIMVDELPAHIVEKFWAWLQEKDKESAAAARPAPPTPLAQAQELDPRYRSRPHLVYLSDRLAAAVADVEAGKTRRLVISMPPREGKSQMTSVEFITWLLRKHPDWKIGLLSHSPSLASGWGRAIRSRVREFAEQLGVRIAADAGAVTEWRTTEEGMVVSRSWKESITGLGFKVFIVDDVVKDFADAHSATMRQAVWDWWLATARTRIEEPALIIVIGTRWHEDDIIGRLLSHEHEGNPESWEQITFPAIAEEHDVLGRKPGEPLLSPIIDETPEEALERWAETKAEVGSYTWAALYQQHPSPSKGAIFDTDWWRYWTRNPQLASRTEDGDPDPNGRIMYVEPERDLATATWLDSWDCAFKATSDSDYVVGQRWAHKQPLRFLIHQVRARLSFTATLAKMLEWADPLNPTAPYSARVHKRLVEDKANGTAIIDTLRKTVPGIKPINPTNSKVARARAVTPECEAGNVVIPLPSDPGNEWVVDWVSELRDFPNVAHDDQTDATTQALSEMRTPQGSSLNVPGRRGALPQQRRGQVALAQTRRVNRAGGR